MEHPAKSPGIPSPVPEGNSAQQLQGQNDHIVLSMQGSNSNLLHEDPSSPNALNNDRAAEVQDLQRVDKNARTVLHRAALDQNHSLVIQLCERADKVGLVNYVDTIDKFGNTPLLSACVMHNNQTSKNKLHCIEALIKNKADPNKRNDTTLWTPLTWCSFYGETEAIKKLLENKAFPYLADNEGRFPLDHCGLQVFCCI
jgi:biopolymer transport protein ExbD